MTNSGCVVFASSGTNGSKRRVTWTSEQLAACAARTSRVLSTLPDAGELVIAHAMGAWSIGVDLLLAGMQTGLTVHPVGRGDLEEFSLETIESCTSPILATTSLYAHRLADYCKRNDLRLPPITTLLLSGKLIDVDEWLELEERWGAPIVSLYGSAEFGSMGFQSRASGAMTALDNQLEFATANVADEPGQVLRVRWLGDCDWGNTGDAVSDVIRDNGRIVGFRIQGRVDGALMLDAGTKLTLRHIALALSESHVDHPWQVIVRTAGGERYQYDAFELRIPDLPPESDTRKLSGELFKRLIRHNPDLEAVLHPNVNFFVTRERLMVTDNARKQARVIDFR